MGWYSFSLTAGESPKMKNVVAQHPEMDLNTKSLPKQKTIKSLIYRTQGFQITINENPPTREIFFSKFWLSRAGIEPRTFGLDV